MFKKILKNKKGASTLEITITIGVALLFITALGALGAILIYWLANVTSSIDSLSMLGVISC